MGSSNLKPDTNRGVLYGDKLIKTVVVGVTFCLMLFGVGLHSAQAYEIHPTRIIGKLKPGVQAQQTRAALRKIGVKINKTLASNKVSIMEITRKGVTVQEALGKLEATGNFLYLEPDYKVYATITPNDSHFSSLWGMHNTGQADGTPDADIDAPEAWDFTTGSSDIVVAVIDTGVDYNHVDLAANMWTNPGEIPGNGIDDDGNGVADDIYGIDLVNMDADPIDDEGHGTHCSGTIGGVGNNGTGVVGVNWNVKIMALKFLNANGFGYTSDAVICLDYAVMMKTQYGVNLKLTNNSWVGGGYSQALADAIQASADADMLFIAAAGNNYGNDNDARPQYPSNYDIPNVISVAATNHNDLLANFSNFGATTVDLGAPGANILSTFPGNTYSGNSGTSMATPHVAGAAALAWDMFPSSNYIGIKSLLLNTVDPIPSLSGKVLTGGRLNLFNAVSCVEGDPQLTIGNPADSFAYYTSNQYVLQVILADCATNIIGATVMAIFSNGESSVQLFDDGVAPDAIANDGIYMAYWSPETGGPVTVNFEATTIETTMTGSVTGYVTAITPYIVDDTIPYDWIDATAGIDTGIIGGYGYADIPFGFGFEFYGVMHDSVRVSATGYLTFDTYATGYMNSAIPNTDIPNEFIAPFWDDLTPDESGKIYYLAEGTAPNRRITFQWNQVTHTGITEPVTFQATLYEGTNAIIFQYQDVIFDGSSYDNGGSATVGIEESRGVAGEQYSYNQPVIYDGDAILFMPDVEINFDIDLTCNKTDFAIGDTVNTTIAIANNSNVAIDADIWVFVELPSGVNRYYGSWTTTPTPAASCLKIPQGALVTDYPILNYTFPEGSEGVYTGYAILSPCGADISDPESWFASDVVPITVSIPGLSE